MNSSFIKDVLNKLKNNEISIDEAFETLKDLPYLAVKNIKFDLHRNLRRALPEVVYGEKKSYEDIEIIIKEFVKKKENLLITRLSQDFVSKLRRKFKNFEYDRESRVFFLKNREIEKVGKGKILVLSAGTSDYPVAREAELCAHYLGNDVSLIVDVGVAGFHRIVDYKDEIKKARVLIVVAGMEGALPSFVAGMIDKPVIGVPTSVGYGANLGGLTALFGMLCNCSGGVAVVNIDNGFGAAYYATLINMI